MAYAAPSKTLSSPLRATRGKRSISDRQFDAYLQTKKTLRRLRAAAALSAAPPGPSEPGGRLSDP